MIRTLRGSRQKRVDAQFSACNLTDTIGVSLTPTSGLTGAESGVSQLATLMPTLMSEEKARRCDRNCDTAPSRQKSLDLHACAAVKENQTPQGMAYGLTSSKS